MPDYFRLFLSKIRGIDKAMLIIFSSIHQKTCAELRRSTVQFISATLKFNLILDKFQNRKSTKFYFSILKRKNIIIPVRIVLINQKA